MERPTGEGADAGKIRPVIKENSACSLRDRREPRWRPRPSAGSVEAAEQEEWTLRNRGNRIPALWSDPSAAAGPLLTPEEAGEWKSGQKTSGAVVQAGEGGTTRPIVAGETRPIPRLVAPLL
ncbi:hypothetical protein NDU88_004458 [Pleurodeles waltl]|uniref:Uncharacterized protein n=1 Tax=Pleurodeles waltl TaxID=8319 RepID=A0AAV7SIU2_PLEWA|nr:hypothetical protein NDU88_004458 [Pleurodeles waltl]